MATPEFITQLREHIGNAPLWVPATTTVVIREVPADAPIWEVPTVLLVKRADTGNWTPIGGICEPGEQPHATAVREVKEETGLDIEPVALLGTGAVGPVTYPNGDVCQFMDTAISARLLGDYDQQPVVADDESVAVQWCSVAQLPQSVSARHRLVIADAVAHMKNPARFRPRLGFTKRNG
ncbi:NUDIX domain-containing protein [Corynebacterium pseudodiphtheriticum]|uniref:NUDIX hydrolase n=1 Tax=Corynebacterium pseudodiphtheriticum TaxID=37637 RepID=UPI0020C178BA|nr:NUDIX domain-containing protein [Corynebacterium pseudodiphtheriticum]MDK8545155.1 NUDIX domain-containing protein [Corynebacterium pseudodiphtheriticum]MDK8717351.1 NUDIX domain-containing protein [Corynebacterium pseudodiphtheriticum]MDK8760197.1 NUDIX domain-containing protein [Corynebacterium pseudodiphtheriticum]UQV53583.1 NUDIX domain-containing protein [Corynebacterium pseudodiphtheriticum]